MKHILHWQGWKAKSTCGLPAAVQSVYVDISCAGNSAGTRQSVFTYGSRRQEAVPPLALPVHNVPGLPPPLLGSSRPLPWTSLAMTNAADVPGPAPWDVVIVETDSGTEENATLDGEARSRGDNTSDEGGRRKVGAQTNGERVQGTAEEEVNSQQEVGAQTNGERVQGTAEEEVNSQQSILAAHNSTLDAEELPEESEDSGESGGNPRTGLLTNVRRVQSGPLEKQTAATLRHGGNGFFRVNSRLQFNENSDPTIIQDLLRSSRDSVVPVGETQTLRRAVQLEGPAPVRQTQTLQRAVQLEGPGENAGPLDQNQNTDGFQGPTADQRTPQLPQVDPQLVRNRDDTLTVERKSPARYYEPLPFPWIKIGTSHVPTSRSQETSENRSRRDRNRFRNRRTNTDSPWYIRTGQPQNPVPEDRTQAQLSNPDSLRRYRTLLHHSGLQRDTNKIFNKMTHSNSNRDHPQYTYTQTTTQDRDWRPVPILRPTDRNKGQPQSTNLRRTNHNINQQQYTNLQTASQNRSQQQYTDLQRTTENRSQQQYTDLQRTTENRSQQQYTDLPKNAHYTSLQSSKQNRAQQQHSNLRGPDQSRRQQYTDLHTARPYIGQSQYSPSQAVIYNRGRLQSDRPRTTQSRGQAHYTLPQTKRALTNTRRRSPGSFSDDRTTRLPRQLFSVHKRNSQRVNRPFQYYNDQLLQRNKSKESSTTISRDDTRQEHIRNRSSSSPQTKNTARHVKTKRPRNSNFRTMKTIRNTPAEIRSRKTFAKTREPLHRPLSLKKSPPMSTTTTPAPAAVSAATDQDETETLKLTPRDQHKELPWFKSSSQSPFSNRRSQSQSQSQSQSPFKPPQFSSKGRSRWFNSYSRSEDKPSFHSPTAGAYDAVTDHPHHRQTLPADGRLSSRPGLRRAVTQPASKTFKAAADPSRERVTGMMFKRGTLRSESAKTETEDSTEGKSGDGRSSRKNSRQKRSADEDQGRPTENPRSLSLKPMDETSNASEALLNGSGYVPADAESVFVTGISASTPHPTALVPSEERSGHAVGSLVTVLPDTGHSFTPTHSPETSHNPEDTTSQAGGIGVTTSEYSFLENWPQVPDSTSVSRTLPQSPDAAPVSKDLLQSPDGVPVNKDLLQTPDTATGNDSPQSHLSVPANKNSPQSLHSVAASRDSQQSSYSVAASKDKPQSRHSIAANPDSPQSSYHLTANKDSPQSLYTASTSRSLPKTPGHESPRSTLPKTPDSPGLPQVPHSASASRSLPKTPGRGSPRSTVTPGSPGLPQVPHTASAGGAVRLSPYRSTASLFNSLHGSRAGRNGLGRAQQDTSNRGGHGTNPKTYYPATRNGVEALLQVLNTSSTSSSSDGQGDSGEYEYFEYDPVTNLLTLLTHSVNKDVERQRDTGGSYFLYNPSTQELSLVTDDDDILPTTINNNNNNNNNNNKNGELYFQYDPSSQKLQLRRTAGSDNPSPFDIHSATIENKTPSVPLGGMEVVGVVQVERQVDVDPSSSTTTTTTINSNHNGFLQFDPTPRGPGSHAIDEILVFLQRDNSNSDSTYNNGYDDVIGDDTMLRQALGVGNDVIVSYIIVDGETARVMRPSSGE